MGDKTTFYGGLSPVKEGPASAFAIWGIGGPPDTLSGGTDTTPVSGTVYYGQVIMPFARRITGIGYNVGSVGGTNNAIASLYDADGNLIANSALAGVLVGTLNTIQEIPFLNPVDLPGPGLYWAGISMNGTTARLRVTVANARGGSLAGVFGTLAKLTPLPTTPTAALLSYLY